VLTAVVPPSAGVLRHGKNTRIAYLDQERSGLRDDLTVFENVAGDRGPIELGGETYDARTYLERFLFSPQDQRQKVSTLSGGERARVALARLLRDGANVIVLDEPTNDLDVMTLGALEEALIDYRGTLLVVTHDRWFLDRVATSILAFEDGRVTQYQGGWSDWSERRAEALADAARAAAARKVAAAPVVVAKPVARKGLSFTERHELDGLLEKVDAAEQQVAALEAEMCSEGFYARPQADQASLLAKLEAARGVAAKLVARWTELEERRDG
jgi:ATP-binding cassette subfamily F protein uup